jgi:excinuclease ABC subunit B
LGSPEYYKNISLEIKLKEKFDRDEIVKKLLDMQYNRSDLLSRGKFRLTGNTLEVIVPGREIIVRIIVEDDRVKKISEYDFLTGEELGKLEQTLIYPAKHFVVPEPVMKESLGEIEKEMAERVRDFKKKGKILEAERILRRTRQDIEMMKEIGYCNGIENYSRYLSGRGKGETPYTLLDYFDKDFLIVIDESHVTIPQIGGMFSGDYSRKTALVENGFRLPSAYDNRPLKFQEFEKKINQSIFVSATPSKYEAQNSKNIVEQIIRPTGLIDPQIEIKSARGQVKDVMKEIEKIVARKERVLITALTKKQAEDLADFLKESKIKSEYLHSGVDTLDRIRILEKLRRGDIDVLVGVNLLREGLDLPEVSLVAIFDADKEGFLRSETSLIQTIGRAARNVRGKVILYADNLTGSMKRAISETNRRRKLQMEYNKKHHITPRTIEKKIQSIVDHEIKSEIPKEFVNLENLEDIAGYIKQREREMKDAARNLEFEKAAIIRDEIGELRKLQIK